jgi:hypothetical protein
LRLPNEITNFEKVSKLLKMSKLLKPTTFQNNPNFYQLEKDQLEMTQTYKNDQLHQLLSQNSNVWDPKNTDNQLCFWYCLAHALHSPPNQKALHAKAVDMFCKTKVSLVISPTFATNLTFLVRTLVLKSACLIVCILRSSIHAHQM